MEIIRRISLLTSIWMVGMFLLGCNGPTTRESELVSPTVRDPGIIALVPLFKGQSDTADGRLARCPKCEGFISVGEIAPEGSEVITGLLRRRLSRGGYNLVSPEMIERIHPASRNLEEKPEVFARRVALQLTADSVLMGWVFKYKERIGGDWAAEEPAAVAFVTLLFAGKDGRLLWRARFDETQRPLSEDVLRFGSFVRRGGRWVTAQQLASDGINRALLSFPGQGEVKVNP